MPNKIVRSNENQVRFLRLEEYPRRENVLKHQELIRHKSGAAKKLNIKTYGSYFFQKREKRGNDIIF